MVKKIKISNEEINKVVSAALRKKAKQQPKMDVKYQFHFAGKDYKLQFTRRYHKGTVSLCNPASCNAGDGCCHLRKVNGIDLCYDASDNYDLLEYHDIGGIIWNINEERETQIFATVRHVLSLIEEKRRKDK